MRRSSTRRPSGFDYLDGSADVDFASGDLLSVGFEYGAVTLPPETKLNP
jgi:hypothetical protein